MAENLEKPVKIHTGVTFPIGSLCSQYVCVESKAA